MRLHNTLQSIAIGSFDGIHTAHKVLIDQADAVVIIERNGGYLTPGYKRSLYAKKPCYFYHLEKLKALNPQLFVAKLQEDFPQLQKIIIGYDFHFGKDKKGNSCLLKELFDGEVVIVEEVCVDVISVHSRVIKAYLKEGNIQRANSLLGRAYSIEGTVIRGQGIGKKELVATLNIETKWYQLPLDGVYATRTKVDNRWFYSISFLGHRLSTDGSFAIETHILDQRIEQNSPLVEIEFIEFIRSNKKFAQLKELKQQIIEDTLKAKSLLKELS